MPMPARTNAISAKAPMTRSCVDRDAVSRSTMSASVRDFGHRQRRIGARTMARIDGGQRLRLRRRDRTASALGM